MRLLSYVKLVRECKNVEFIVDTREEIVKMSMEIGINKCAKMYNTSRNTIKRWKKRYLELGRFFSLFLFSYCFFNILINSYIANIIF